MHRDSQPSSNGCVCVTIESSEAVGFAGRTGVGKSTLIMAIFRLASVHIGGMDIGNLSLVELRWRIAIAPQEPVMSSGQPQYRP